MLLHLPVGTGAVAVSPLCPGSNAVTLCPVFYRFLTACFGVLNCFRILLLCGHGYTTTLITLLRETFGTSRENRSYVRSCAVGGATAGIRFLLQQSAIGIFAGWESRNAGGRYIEDMPVMSEAIRYTFHDILDCNLSFSIRCVTTLKLTRTLGERSLNVVVCYCLVWSSIDAYLAIYALCTLP